MHPTGIYDAPRLGFLFRISQFLRRKYGTLLLHFGGPNFESSTMSSNQNTTGTGIVHEDSWARDRAVATTILLATAAGNIAPELRATISNLGLLGLENVEMPPESASARSRMTGFTSEFEKYCETNGIENAYPNDLDHFKTFIYTKDLAPSPKDPEHYPGIQHASSLLLRDMEAEDGDNFDHLDQELQDMLMAVMNCRYSARLARGRFLSFKTIGGGKTGKYWQIRYQLTGIAGDFNRGVYLVRDPTSKPHIMKTLPSTACYPGFASREVSILQTLKNDNIIKFFDGRVPIDRHETGWLVTEYCDKGTLGDIVKKYVNRKTSIPEIFAWWVFESVVRAVVYLHYGPDCLHMFDLQGPEDKPLELSVSEGWDPVYHRDIILSNLFCTSSPHMYPMVKLGDFGCAMQQSEIATKDSDEYPWSKETPTMDNDYEPPEGQYATKAVDVYQIGRLMWCVLQNTACPSGLDEVAMIPANFGTSKFAHYSLELRCLLDCCTQTEPGNRPDSLRLLQDIRHHRSVLASGGRLPFVQLLPEV